MTMNDSEKWELNELKLRQLALERQLTSLSADIRRLDARALHPETTSMASPLPAAAPASTVEKVSPGQTRAASVPPPLPAFVQSIATTATPAMPVPAARPSTVEFVADFVVRQSGPAQTKPEPVPPVSPLVSQASEQPKASFEMRLGTYWLVRIAR